MSVELIDTILTGLVTLFGGTFGVLWFYQSKKKEAAANASKAEAESIAAFANEWKDLYEQRDKRVNELNAVIDALYKQIGELRDQVNRLKGEMAVLTAKHNESEYWKCQRAGCEERIPPHELSTARHKPEPRGDEE